ncbi:unnamed product, partial [Ostreococcus tauri]
MNANARAWGGRAGGEGVAAAGARGRGARVARRGAAFTREDFEMERQIGEGSFGVVYEGRVVTNGARGL